MALEFKKKNLAQESVPEILKKAREDNELSLRDASAETGIKESYLEAMEKGAWDRLPRGVYTKNFVKEYALVLGLNPVEVMEIFNSEMKQTVHDQKIFSRQTPGIFSFLIFPKVLKNLLIFLLIFVCLLYLGFYVKNLLTKPELVLEYPAADLNITQDEIRVIGRSEPEAEITINGKTILNDPNGNFNHDVQLKEGVNTLTVTAKKKYSKINTITRKIVVEK